MKKNGQLLPIIIYLFSLASQLQAQSITVWPGTKTPYPIAHSPHYTPPLAGYKPVFINYAGRHGARFLTKAGSDVIVFALLNKADSQHALSEIGSKVKEMVARFLTLEKNNYENITLLGKQEQKRIGERMLSNYREVFTGRRLEIAVTHKVRTQQSADAFLGAFKGYAGKITYRNEPAMQEDVLRFYDVSPAYLAYEESRAVQGALDSLENDPNTLKVIKDISLRFFKDEFAKQLTGQGIAVNNGKKTLKVNAALFVTCLYDLYGVQFSVSANAKQNGFKKDAINFAIAFTEKELSWLQFKDGAADFLQKGPATDAKGLQVSIAVPLLVNFISTMDSAALYPRIYAAAFLRFTHAEAISPFAALLGLPGAATASSSIFRYQDYWKAFAIVPMSANIQWILYGNGKEYLVKVLLNEKEVALPIHTANYPYYKWHDVKNYYLHLLQSLHTGLQADMHKYLLDLK